MVNPLDKFELGIRKLIEDLVIERMAENDKIVGRSGLSVLSFPDPGKRNI
jgi:hypothetical protein